MKKQSVLIGAFLLAIGGFLAKAIGALYKIPLANILGSNGMGVYHLIFPIYSLLLVLISSGISVAVSRMVSFERAGNNKHNQILIFNVSISLVFVLGTIFSILLVVLSEPLSYLQGNTNASLGYFAIAPAIVFASLISVVRAYFQGLQNMIPTSLSNVIEQIVKMVFGLLLANMFIGYGVEYAVFGAILAVTISEFVAFVILVINFIYMKKKTFDAEELQPTTENLTSKQVLKSLISYSLPATLSSLIIPITAFMDSFMVINLLTSTGQSSVVATSLYGINSGVVNTLISLPVIFTMALATAIVPNLSGLHAKNAHKEVSFKCSFFIKTTWLFSLPCFMFLLIFAPDIIQILYAKGLTDKVINEFEFAYKMLMVASVSVIYYSFLQTFTSILQSINKPAVPFYSMISALIIRIILVVILIKIPQVNVFGLIISNIVFLTIATLINLAYLRKYIKLEFSFLRLFVIPIFSVLISGISAYLIKIFVFTNMLPIVYVVICGVVAVAIYTLLLYSLKVFNVHERKMFPRIKKVTKSKAK